MNKQALYWKQSAEDDWETSRVLFKAKRYDACLFFCHLTLEKVLKGLVVMQTKKEAPYTHDLIRLTSLAQISVSAEQAEQLNEISTFNITGRYKDEKYAFHKRAVKPYCEAWLVVGKKLYLWLKKEYPSQ